MTDTNKERAELIAAAPKAAPAPASGELVAEVMFDERKYIQYTIPLELLPVGAKFYTAQEARVPLSDLASLLSQKKTRGNPMTDTTTLAPTDAEILDAAEDFRSQYTHGGTTFDEFDEIGFARAILAKWGAPAPASGAAEAGLRALADRIEEAQGRAICISVEGADYLRNALAASAAVAPAPAPASGELVAEVMFDERKYIQYTIPLELLPVGAKFYTAQEARVPLDRIARDLLLDVKNRVNALVLLPSSERRESEIRIKQDIADFLAAPPVQEVRVPLSDAEALAIVRSVPALVTAEEEWLWAIREVEKHHGITAAQKETP